MIYYLRHFVNNSHSDTHYICKSKSIIFAVFEKVNINMNFRKLIFIFYVFTAAFNNILNR